MLLIKQDNALLYTLYFQTEWWFGVVFYCCIFPCLQGAVHTFGNLDAQMQNMINAWEWTADDIILHVLPLHHVHGVVNVLMTSLNCGATCVMLPGFDAKSVSAAVLYLVKRTNSFTV